MTEAEILELEREWIPCVNSVDGDLTLPGKTIGVQYDGRVEPHVFAIELACRIRRMAVRHELDVPLIQARIHIGSVGFDIHFERQQ